MPDGCTAALALPEATADGVLLHGQNWDWRAECAETGVVLRIRRDDGPDILTFTEAGGLARSGLNSAGIGLTANALECDRDYQRGPGVPLPFIRRKVLEAPLALRCRPSFAAQLGSNHMAVSHATALGARRGFGFNARPTTLSAGTRSGPLVRPDHGCPSRPRPGEDTRPRRDPCSIYRDSAALPALTKWQLPWTIPLGLLRRWGSPWRYAARRGSTPRRETATTAMS